MTQRNHKAVNGITTSYQLPLTNYILPTTLSYEEPPITRPLITDYLLFAEVLHIVTGRFIESQTVKFAVGSDGG